MTVPVRNPDRSTARGRVYCFRGQGMIFSPGMGVVCSRLRREGFYARDLRCMADRWVVRTIQKDLQTGIPLGPVIFLGHSAGARAAIHASHQLQANNLIIDLLITVDVAYPPLVPNNVKRAMNIYRSEGRIYPAAPLVGVCGSATSIHNIDLDSTPSPIQKQAIHHFNITSHPGVQRLILDAILNPGI